MIMPILLYIRKKKMNLSRLLFSLCFSQFLIMGSLMAFELDGHLKTINLAMPTNFGIFLGEIHYAEKDKAQALRVERVIKEDLIKVINYFEYVPHDVVHFNLDPYLRLTNGNARPFPTNIINLYNFPANNNEHLVSMENWLQGLVLHEFVHIVHLDQTRDYLQVGRKIFGTVAKLPTSLVPRWFTEGIAVWGESHLMTGGRLNNPLFNKELLLQFKKNEFCKSIDCLDNPGVYPGGSLAYWAGAQFIDYIERKKANSIKCLVEANSQLLPFFLNNAFKDCIGENVQDLFVKFRDDFIASESRPVIDSSEWSKKIENIFGSDDFQKGMILDGERLFKVEQLKDSEALVAYDLKNNIGRIAHFDSPISDLGSIVDIDDENRFLLVAFNEDPHYRLQNKVWKLVNPNTFKIERVLNFDHDPSYVIALGGERFITFSYWKNQWIVAHNGEILVTFSTDDNITLVKKVGEKLLLKINDSRGVSRLILTDFRLSRMSVIYQSSSFYDLPLITEKFLVKREKSELKLIEYNNEASSSVYISNLDLPKDITFGLISEGRALILEDRLKSKSFSDRELSVFLKKAKSKTELIKTSEFQDATAAKESFSSSEAESYPRLDHLIPHYWFLATGNSDKLGSIGAMTSFVDPMEIYSLNATGLVYPSVKKIGGSLEYNQKLIGISDLWRVSASFNQEYSKNDFSPVTNLSRDLFARTYYNIYQKRWSFTPGFFVGKSSTDDFISDRSTTEIGVSAGVSYQAQSFDDFFQTFLGTAVLQTNDSNLGQSYLATSLSSEIAGRFTSKLLGSIKTTFEKYDKSDFKSGVIYAGGVDDYTKARGHDFYGLIYGNAFGNKIFTAKEMIDYNFQDIYRGVNLIPFFVKEMHLLAGIESLYANRILLGANLLRDKMVNGFFIGPRLKADLFYFVPATIDVIFSTLDNPMGSRKNQVEFVLSADIMRF